MLGRDPTGAGYTVPSSVGRMFTLSACCARSARSCLLQVTASARPGSPGRDTWLWRSSATLAAILAASSAAGSALAAWNCACAAASPWSDPATVNQIVLLACAGRFSAYVSSPPAPLPYAVSSQRNLSGCEPSGQMTGGSCGPRNAVPVLAEAGASPVAPTIAAQWCGAAFGTGGVPSSVKTSLPLSAAAWSGVVNPHG